MAEIRINATGGVKLYDSDDSHYAQIIAGTITSNVDAITLGHDTVTIADNLSLGSDSSVLKFGADGDTTLTHTDGTGLTLNSTNKLCFNDATQFIQGASGTVLDIAATDEIELTATLLDVNANLDVSGTSLLPTLGVITAKDLGVGVHIRTADSGASVAGSADELIIEGSAHCGMTFLTGTSQTNSIAFGDSGDNDIGLIEYNHSTDLMQIWANATKQVGLGTAGFIFNEASADLDFRVESGAKTHHFFLDGGTNDGAAAFGDSAPETGTGGITLNQTSLDNSILSMKSNDIAHGITSQAETDTYGLFKKNSGTNGGFKIISLSEGDNSFQVQGFVTSDNTTQNASAGAPIKLDARKKDGTSVGSMGANANLLVVQNDGTGRFIVDEDGDILYDGGASGYDSYDDAQLVRAVSNYKTPDAIIQGKFDKFVKYNYKDLQEAKILGTNSPEDDAKGLKPFIKIGALQRLHNGAIWQQYTKHQQLLEAVYDLAKEAVGEEKAEAILDKHEVKRLQ